MTDEQKSLADQIMAMLAQPNRFGIIHVETWKDCRSAALAKIGGAA